MKTSRIALFIALNLILIACSHAGKAPESTGGTNLNPDSKLLNDTVNAYAEARKRLDPFWATIYNVEEDLSKFGDFATSAYLERAKQMRQVAFRKSEGCARRPIVRC